MRKFIQLILFVLVFIPEYAAGQGNGSVIRGTVRDGEGKALAGASVSIENSSKGVLADESGAFVIPGLTDGKYTLKVSFLGYEPYTGVVRLVSSAYVDVVLDSAAVETEEVLVSATRAGEHAPFTYTTINKELLDRRNTGQDIPFLLGLTPSLVESSEAGNGIGYTSQRIRGTDGSRINVTIDGIPLNDPESQQVFWVDLPDLASSAENIQIQRGVGTSSNGAGAFGATISISTENPGSKPEAEINSSAGSFNTFRNMVSASTGLLGNRFALKMRYSDVRSDGYIDRTGSNHQSAFISGVLLAGRSRIRGNIILGSEHTGIGWWGVPKEILPLNRRYNPAGEYFSETGEKLYYENESDNYDQNHYQLIHNITLNDYLTLNYALHYTRGKGYYEEYRQGQLLPDYGITPFSIGDSLISETDLVRRKWLSNDFYGVVYSLKYKKEKLEASAGGGINYYDGDHFGRLIWMKNAGTTPKDYQWYLNNSGKWEASFYGKVSYSISDAVNAFGDLQYRHIGYKMEGIDDDLKDLGQDHTYGFFNPKAGLFFNISNSQDAYISFAVANREPSRADFKEASGDPEATPRPERLYDIESGYNLRSGKQSFGVNFYAMLYKDQLVPTGELSDVGYSITTNVGKSYRTGIELITTLKPVSFISWDMNLTLSRNRITCFTEYYTDYISAENTSEYKSKYHGNTDLAYSPSVIGSSDIAFTAFRGMSVHLISKYVGKQYFDNTQSEERTIDPYFVNGLRLDYEPEIKGLKGLQLQLLVNNILNTEYESNAYGGNWYEDGVEKTWSYYFPQAGTNFMFRAGIRF